MSADPHRVEKILAEAEAIADPAARAARLDAACAGDAALRAEVESLLAAYEKAGTYLDRPVPGALFAVPPSGPDDDPAKAGTANHEQPGQCIGRYKLLEKIGEGGFGDVWMAEQREPVRRRVALKVIKLGMDTKEVVARFEAERQALALMDHPNIAKVHDGGATETGRPYFVMELVRGTRLTNYCDEQRLSVEERLGLFMQVCRAVQHAHEKGIIHRDLKPSNILVTVNDGVAVPKVIDFGIAKATDQRLTDKTVFTRFMQFLGTPAYMSPEQAELTSLDIDTRSDIYSLGVVLYELLTSRTPFDATELFTAGLDEIRRVIRDQEPDRPSTRLRALPDAERTTTAKRRRTEMPKLLSVLSGDLDWIVMKCLEKDRARRYQTATSLAADLQRQLQSEPIIARPPSTAYRIQKFIRRHRVGARIVVTCAVGLVAAFLITFAVMQANRNRVASMKAKANAWDYQRPSLNDTGRVTELLRSIETSVSSVARRGGISDLNTRQLAYEVARAHLLSGRFADAERSYREYLDPLRKAGVTNSDSLSGVLSGLSQALQGQGKFAEAEPVLREYLGILERGPLDIWHTSKVRARLGSVLLAQKKHVEAEPQLLEGYGGMMQADRSVAKEIRDIRVPYEKQAGEWIVQLYIDWDKAAEADKWREKLK
jgi:serine/threonine protein kinase